MEENNTSKDLSVVQKLVGVFFSPRDSFESIDRKPDWLVPLIVVVLITLIFTMVTLPITMPEQMEKQRVKFEERGMSDDEIDQAMAMGEKIGKISGPIGAVIVVPIMLLIFALIFWFVGNIVLGGQTTFKKMFSVYTYSSLIGMFGLLLRIPLILSKQTADVHFSIASFLPADQSKTFVYNILKGFDIFAIWQYIVLAIGFAVIYKFSMKKSGWTMAVLFLITILISAGFSQMFG
ncbi:YIP1 family protein [candidate division KSB1 bacterium]|nr:YIP1 family protein [candidate division KSB1 bacterium]MBL7092601.1 YIP1 family protein [candidate division KSB1 bacterium]